MGDLLVVAVSAVFAGLFGWALVRIATGLLFRPATPLKVLGVRLPFTSGIWLRVRDDFARAAAAHFARDLSVASLLEESLGDASTRTAFSTALSSRLSSVLGHPLASRDGADAVIGDLAGRALSGLLASPEFSGAFERAAAEVLTVLSDLPLEVLLPADRAGRYARDLLSPASLDILSSRIGGWLEGRGGDKAGQHGSAGLPMSGTPLPHEPFVGVVPASSLSPLVALVVDALYDAAIPVVENFLNDVDTRVTIEKAANETVRRAVSRLPVVQRIIAGAANYERSIAETMPETVEDLVSMVSSIIRSPSMRTRAREAALDGWEAPGDRGSGLVVRFGASLSREALWRAIAAMLSRLVENSARIAERVEAGVAARKSMTLGEVFRPFGLGGDGHEGATLDVPRLLALVGGPGPLADSFDSARRVFVEALREGLAARPLGQILALNAGAVASLSTRLTEAGLEALAGESEAIARGLDIEGLVFEKLRSIDNSEARNLTAPALAKGSVVLTLAFGVAGGLAGLLDLIIAKMMGG